MPIVFAKRNKFYCLYTLTKTKVCNIILFIQFSVAFKVVQIRSNASVQMCFSLFKKVLELWRSNTSQHVCRLVFSLLPRLTLRNYFFSRKKKVARCKISRIVSVSELDYATFGQNVSQSRVYGKVHCHTETTTLHFNIDRVAFVCL